MPEPERLDIQVRKVRHRRDALRVGLPVAFVMIAVAVYGMWRAIGWHWWYVPLSVAGVVFAVWIARLESDLTEEATRWFWWPPR